MVRESYKDLVCWIACSYSFFFLLLSGNAAANKEGYYGKYIGKLSQLHHGVSGDVFAVDARTLHIRNFNYDGEGPAAYFYAGSSKAPGVNGFRLRDERGTTNVLPRYRNKHVTITLPEGKNLQNVRWFSVWCDEFSVNFGDVKIPKNLDFPKPQKISGLSGVHGVSSEPIVIVDAQTLLIPSFSYDGEAPDAKFWVGRGFKPSPQGIRIPDENGKELPLRRYDRKTIVLTLPGDLTIFDIGHFGVWCEAFTVDFGHVQIPRGLNIPPSLKMLGVSPQSKLNCEVLWDDFAYEVRWAVAGDSIVLQLVARLENNEYMSFGLSGDKSRSRMVGGDVVVAWVDKESLKGYAKDYYLDAKSQCSGGRGSCPDENIQAGAESVRLLNAALVNGYSIVTFQRSLKAQDEFDKDVFTNASQPIIWAVGPLNSRKEVSYHSLANRGDIFIDFGRAPKWNCPTPESVSDQSESEDPTLGHEYEEARIQNTKSQDPNRRESRPKSQLPTPAPVPKTTAWEIPPIKCYEPEDGVFYAQMGPTGGKHGYSAITGHVGWGISWYINGLLIPEINVVRGRTYTFIVEGGLDPETPARYHPFYITDDPVGGYQYKTPQERANIQIFAGAVQNKRGEVRPTGVGRLCNWTPDPNAPPADEFNSFGAYQRTLRLECDPGNPGIIQWTVEKDTPDTVYYQCYTHRYLGWKINVHDHCEGEGTAASESVPSILKAPTSVVKSYEGDSEGSESINFEIRVKPDAELLKNIQGKDQTNFGPNELVSVEATSKYNPQLSEKEEEFKNSKNAFGYKVPAPVKYQAPQIEDFQYPMQVGLLLQRPASNVPQPSFVLEKTFGKFPKATLPLKPSGYSVTEEPLEENGQQNFQIIPALLPQYSEFKSDHPIFSPEEIVRTPGQINGAHVFQEFTKDLEISRAPAEEKQKRNNQKLPYHSKQSNRWPGAPARLRKPPSLNLLTLQQRPFPPGAFRPPSLSQKPQKRPMNLGSHKTLHNVPTKPAHSHERVNVALLGSQQFSKQESQANRPNKFQQSVLFGSQDLFGSSTVSKPSGFNVPRTPLAQNTGFDPQSVQVEGGFKPILNTGIAPQSNSGLIERADLEVAKDEDDKNGVIDLITNQSSSQGESLVRDKQETSSVVEEGLEESDEHKDKEIDLFKNQKPQTFDPIFIPSYPDDSIKKYHEKYKKKIISNPKSQQRSGQIYIKIRPSANVVRRPLYPDNVVPPFKISHQAGMPQLRSQESVNFEDSHLEGQTTQGFTNDTFDKNPKAENILQVLQMYEKKGINNKTRENTDGLAEEKTLDRDREAVQDEIAMADERKDFYLPPKGNEFLSYNGKVVKGIEAPTLPQARPPTDVSRLPAFGPFEGPVPPLSQTVNAKNLPQLRSSKLARHDILPPSDPGAGETVLKISSHLQSEKIQGRKKRSPDHIPGHEGHDHHSHHHSQHNGALSNAGNDARPANNLFHLLYIAFLHFSLVYLPRYNMPF